MLLFPDDFDLYEYHSIEYRGIIKIFIDTIHYLERKKNSILDTEEVPFVQQVRQCLP